MMPLLKAGFECPLSVAHTHRSVLIPFYILRFFLLSFPLLFLPSTSLFAFRILLCLNIELPEWTLFVSYIPHIYLSLLKELYSAPTIAIFLVCYLYRLETQ